MENHHFLFYTSDFDYLSMDLFIVLCLLIKNSSSEDQEANLAC